MTPIDSWRLDVRLMLARQEALMGRAKPDRQVALAGGVARARAPAREDP